MVVALGSGYQRLFIIPSMNALIVRQGLKARFSDAHFLRLALGRGDFSVWTSFISEARSTAYENVAGFDYPQLLQRDLQVVR